MGPRMGGVIREGGCCKHGVRRSLHLFGNHHLKRHDGREWRDVMFFCRALYILPACFRIHVSPSGNRGTIRPCESGWAVRDTCALSTQRNGCPRSRRGRWMHSGRAIRARRVGTSIQSAGNLSRGAQHPTAECRTGSASFCLFDRASLAIASVGARLTEGTRMSPERNRHISVNAKSYSRRKTMLRWYSLGLRSGGLQPRP